MNIVLVMATRERLESLRAMCSAYKSRHKARLLLISGSPGAGKTCITKRLAETLGFYRTGQDTASNEACAAGGQPRPPHDWSFRNSVVQETLRMQAMHAIKSKQSAFCCCIDNCGIEDANEKCIEAFCDTVMPYGYDVELMYMSFDVNKDRFEDCFKFITGVREAFDDSSSMSKEFYTPNTEGDTFEKNICTGLKMASCKKRSGLAKYRARGKVYHLELFCPCSTEEQQRNSDLALEWAQNVMAGDIMAGTSCLSKTRTQPKLPTSDETVTLGYIYFEVDQSEANFKRLLAKVEPCISLIRPGATMGAMKVMLKWKPADMNDVKAAVKGIFTTMAFENARFEECTGVAYNVQPSLSSDPLIHRYFETRKETPFHLTVAHTTEAGPNIANTLYEKGAKYEEIQEAAELYGQIKFQPFITTQFSKRYWPEWLQQAMTTIYVEAFGCAFT
jgi:hypothetical protein